MAVILCFTRLQTIILCSSPLRRQTATASAEMISNRFSKMSVARLLPYIISLKWREKRGSKPTNQSQQPTLPDGKTRAVRARACACAEDPRRRTVIGRAQSCLCHHVSHSFWRMTDYLRSVVSWQSCKSGIMSNELTRWLLPTSAAGLFNQLCLIH